MTAPIAGKDLPEKIRKWLRKNHVVLKRTTGYQVNRLHIKVEVLRKNGEPQGNPIHFVLLTTIDPNLCGDHHPKYGPQPGWTFATGELCQAADRICRIPEDVEAKA